MGSYIIRGGIEGRERLRVLSRPLAATTEALLRRAGAAGAASCLDVGCGGGDVTLRLAALSGGRVVGVDIDETKLALARGEAGEAAVEYRRHDIAAAPLGEAFDVVYARFLLTHLTDPAGACERLLAAVRPGGRLAVEDIDYGGCFCHPESPAFQRYCEWYTAAARRRGCDPDIGRRLPELLEGAGFEDVEVSVVQPVGRRPGDEKLAVALTMENIADSVVSEGVAEREEIEPVVEELFRLAADARTTMSYPRIVQVTARRPPRRG
jgi:SAM-dependent methyltransferase